MSRIRLLHLRPLEAEPRIAALRALGYEVAFEPMDDRDALKRVWQAPPNAYVFDITRVPSHMRELAISLRKRKTTRHVPMVFTGGEPTKVVALRTVLPDAVYTEWENIGNALAEALTAPPTAPIVPESQFAGYSGTPLPKKLGIKPGMTVALLNAPETFAAMLGNLPEGAPLVLDLTLPRPLAIWFARTRVCLQEGLPQAIDAAAEQGALWIAWPKQKSGVVTDLTQQMVRGKCIAAGLVDYKVVVLDDTWSGLLFTRRK